jgi:gluconate 2-dehydrogenase gamma chain
MIDLQNRRAFLRAAMAAGAAWAAADLVQVDDALAWAASQSAAPAGAGTTTLTKAQADVVEALTSRIIPSVDGRPGAREAGAVYFIDRALGTFNAGQKKAYTDGIADLNRRAAMKSPGAASFAALAPAQQDELLREVEQTPFFQAARFDTIVGTFALPASGGNRDYAGWHMIGFDHQPRFQAPFGYYDAEITGRG